VANVSVAVEIETRIEHDLSTVLQGVADDQSVNVGTLMTPLINAENLFRQPGPPLTFERFRVANAESGWYFRVVASTVGDEAPI
jgi:hypothetical protein